MPTYLTKWVQSFTSNWTLSFYFDNNSETPQPFNSGLPQGSPTSPVLFLIYAQALLEATNTDKVKDISYLDDDGALQLSTTQQLAIQTLQERFEQRLERAEQLNLPYDLGKSGLIHFWTQRNRHWPDDPTTQPSIMINGTMIQPSKTIKYLGVYLDETLTFHAVTEATGW